MYGEAWGKDVLRLRESHLLISLRNPRANLFAKSYTGSSKKTLLSSVTLVPSGLMGCVSASLG